MILISLCVIRIQTDSLFIVTEGFLQIILKVIGKTAVVEKLRVGWGELDCLIIIGDGKVDIVAC